MLKDYYKILELEPSASLPEIKKAYRRLALQFHPDKNPGDAYAAAQFTVIKEAYEVLTNPSKKEFYLQQRWYNQSTGRRKTQTPVNPVSILKLALELDKYVMRLDHFRMDKQGLQEYMLELVNDDTIEKLNSFNEEATNDTIVDILLRCMKPLPLVLARPLYKQLGKIAASPVIQKKRSDQSRLKEKNNKRERYKIWMILILVVLFCLIIFFFGGDGTKT
jgi:curved DNA-binding protein CbpA